jgi:hypothetical protein
VRLLASRPTWSTRVSLFVWLLPLDLYGMGDPTNSYATAGIALRVSRVLKPHHHDKVETSSVGLSTDYTALYARWRNSQQSQSILRNACLL